jgi:glycosyltransferase involved in cell wall biosynthesis
MQRKRIMLSYSYKENWIGGTYYILNIIKALNSINEADKPHLTILHSPESSVSDIEKIGYPYLDFFPLYLKPTFFEKVVDHLCLIFGVQVKYKIRLPFDRIPNFYPSIDALDKSNISVYYAWIPDFQVHHLPEYYSLYERIDKILFQRRIAKSGIPIVFSSRNALDDFNKFYPRNRNKKIVLPFVSVIDPVFEKMDADSVKKKFAIQEPYFVVSNQLWKHKNHLTVIKAFETLIKKVPNVQLIITGKEHDYRHPAYPDFLKAYTAEKRLEQQILFLGFIDRNEQLKLMKESLAIIQPSFFEGWSTVVEDAKAIQKFIILSDIPVHREQIDTNCLFFDPRDANGLAEHMLTVVEKKPAYIQYDHLDAVRKFGYSFLSLFS